MGLKSPQGEETSEAGVMEDHFQADPRGSQGDETEVGGHVGSGCT